MSDNPQWTSEQPYESEHEARVGSREQAIEFVNSLKARGFHVFMPARKPENLHGFTWDQFNGCRVLVGWMPNWSLSRNGGKYVCRLDTLVE